MSAETHPQQSRRPTVSILSPVHNEETHIDEMVHSIINQTYDNWEIVFVDDGSTDGTVASIARLQKTDDRIRLVPPAGKLGKVAAFNAAYEAARGDLIVLLAGDDRLPASSLATRVSDLAHVAPSSRGLSCYKLCSFSDDRRFDDMVLPKGDHVSRSGGVLTMTRGLADALFPIPLELPSEDIWLGASAEYLAEVFVKNPVVVMEYRIHPGNSNPRGRDFPTMSESMAARHEAWRLLAESSLPLGEERRRHLENLYSAELHRRAGKVTSIFRVEGLTRAERVSLASMAHPSLYRVRNRFYRLLSGLQGK